MRCIGILLLVLGLVLSLNLNLWAALELDTPRFYVIAEDSMERVVAVTFSRREEATMEEPWVVADQFIRVTFSADLDDRYIIRIVTDNDSWFPDMYGKPILQGDNDEWDGPPEVVPDSDDVVTYGGLINADTMTDPNDRAQLVWQVFCYDDPNNPPEDPMIIPEYMKQYNTEIFGSIARGMLPHPDSAIEDPLYREDIGYDGTPESRIVGHPDNVPRPEGWDPRDPDAIPGAAFLFDDHWGYVADKSDTGFVGGEPDELTHPYFVVATSVGDGSSCKIANYPVVYTDVLGNIMMDKTALWDIAIFIAASLGRNQGDEGELDGPEDDTIGPLYAGTYTTTVYVEMCPRE